MVSLVTAAGAACYTGPNIDPKTSGPSATEPTVSGTSKSSDLPCEVATFIDTHCAECHSTKPRGGAETTLTTYAALTADYDGRSLAEVALERMKDDAEPMPPDGLLSKSDFAAFAKWVEDGMPQGSCEGLDGPGDIKLTCTSGKFWTEDEDEGSKEMSPGKACITCHTKESGGKFRDHDEDEDDDDDDDDDAPLFTAAGTVYETRHEPDDCYGLGDGTTKVVIIGADKKELTLIPNRAGNFFTEAAIKLPYTARVERNGKKLKMTTPQKNGDCNSCHTAEGGDAPGRITAP